MSKAPATKAYGVVVSFFVEAENEEAAQAGVNSVLKSTGWEPKAYEVARVEENE